MPDSGSRQSSPTPPLTQENDFIDDELPFPMELLGILSLEEAIELSQGSNASRRPSSEDDDASNSTQAEPNRQLIDLLSTLPQSLIMGDDIDIPEPAQDIEIPTEPTHGDTDRVRTALDRDDSDESVVEEQVYPNQPEKWSFHHECFLLTCNGTVQIITEHMQEIFKFSPPLQESFVRSKLVRNAKKQLAFLRRYLPGETHSMLRAEARIVLGQSGLTDPEVVNGKQKIDPMVQQYTMPDPRYTRAKMPPGISPLQEWTKLHDNHLFLFLGDDPENFLRQCRHLFLTPPTRHFVAIRMSQLPFLGLSVSELSTTNIMFSHTVVQRDGMFF